MLTDPHVLARALSECPRQANSIAHNARPPGKLRLAPSRRNMLAAAPRDRSDLANRTCNRLLKARGRFTRFREFSTYACGAQPATWRLSRGRPAVRPEFNRVASRFDFVCGPPLASARPVMEASALGVALAWSGPTGLHSDLPLAPVYSCDRRIPSLGDRRGPKELLMQT
jgi:hypothetical protein